MLSTDCWGRPAKLDVKYSNFDFLTVRLMEMADWLIKSCNYTDLITFRRLLCHRRGRSEGRDYHSALRRHRSGFSRGAKVLKLLCTLPTLFSRPTVVFIRWAPCGTDNFFFFLEQKQSCCRSFPHNNIYVWSPLAWKVWCNYIWNIGEPPPWRGLKKELTAWAWQLVDNLQPPDCVSNGTVRRGAAKTASQGKRGHCNQTRASSSQRQHIKYEWSADQPANVFVHK